MAKIMRLLSFRICFSINLREVGCQAKSFLIKAEKTLAKSVKYWYNS